MTDCPMRLISWNVAHRVRHQPEQLAHLVACEPHLIALQETTEKTARLWCRGLSAAGFAHIVTSFELSADPDVLSGGRRYGQILASRWPLEPLPPTEFDIPWTERVLSSILHTPTGPVEVHTAHIPAGTSHGWIKIETFEGIYRRLARHSSIRRILCGDYNSPKEELEDGTVLAFGEAIGPDGTIRREDDGRWARGERGVITDLAKYDLPDVYRMLHGYGVQEVSWSRQIWGRQRGRRFDHVFASRSLHPVGCGYLHAFRQAGLSDHSPIDVCFDP